MSFSSVSFQDYQLEYIQCDDFPQGQVHCFSTRYGGVSAGSLTSLNLGTHRGDDPKNVYENYRRLGRAVGFTPEDTVFAKQIHTDVVAAVTEKDRGEGLFTEVTEARDALVTNVPGVALTVFTADCCPVLLYDPVKKAIGAAHAGWRGTALGIVKKTVEAMTAHYGCDPADLYAAIGPCLSHCCFETDADVPQAMLAALGDRAKAAITTHGAKFHVDNKRINQIWLERAGVRNIFVAPHCTACEPERFWSHRVTRGDRGSLANIIMLK